MSNHLGVRDARSIPATDSAAVDDPWLDDQTTTKYTRMETESTARETHSLRSADRSAVPSWSRVLTICVGAASCFVFGQVLWSVRTLPSASAMTQPESANARVHETGDEAPLAVEETPSTAATSNIKPSVATKRRGHTKLENTARTRKAAAGAATPNGLPATMQIDSHPWSDVTVDGKPIGRTPQQGISLAPGKHNVLLHNADIDVLKILVLHVLPGESIKRVEQLSESHHHHGQP